MDTADVVVVGSGVAGLTTALVASIFGLKVIVVEKTNLVGGATAYSAGGAFLPGCHHLPLETDASAVITYLQHCMNGRMNRAMVETYLANGPSALALLEEQTEVRFQAYGGVDYRMDVPGASDVGRTVLPVTFDGRALGEALRQLRPPLPTTMIFGGMQVDYRDIDLLTKARRSPPAFLYSAKLVLRHTLDLIRYGRSSRLVFGNALVGRLLKSVRDRRGSIDLRLGARVEALVIESGRVTGVRYREGDISHTVRATRGVMLATGGFPGNSAMRAERTPYAELHKSLPPATNVGDGIDLALGIGARLSQAGFSNYCLTPVSHQRTRKGEDQLFPHFALDRCKPGAIAVGHDGLRFVNEGIVYSEFVPAMYAAKAVPAFLICDYRFLRKYGFGIVLPAPFSYRSHVRNGYLLQAGSIGALARKLGVDSDGLALSVAKNNTYAATGVDLDFGKGADLYSRSLGDPANKPNPCLGSIAKAPFFAIRLLPGDTATTCGLVVNTQAQVLNLTDQPIIGLYAAGPDMANPTMGTNPSGGCNIGPALTFGYIAARHMAAKPNLDSQGDSAGASHDLQPSFAET